MTIAYNTRDTERFSSVFDLLLRSPSTMDPSAPSLKYFQTLKLPIPEHKPHTQVRLEDANCGQLGVKKKERLDDLLHHFITRGLYLTHPKRVPACADGELSLRHNKS